MATHPTLAIVGAGRVGSTLAQSLYRRGFTITAVYSRSIESARRLADKTNSHVAESAGAAATSAQLTLLTVPDDAVRDACEMLARDCDLSGRAVVHTSGVTDVSALQAAQASGAWIGGLHPMLPIMDRDLSVDLMFSRSGALFGLEAADEPLRSWLADIVQTLDGVALWLHPGQDRARYHAASVITSNYLVTLFAEASGLLQSIDPEIDERLIRLSIVRLLEAMLDNIKERGTTKALTGPIVRGDSGTVRKHLLALEQADPQLADVYRLLGLRTLKIAAELDEAKIAEIRENLETRNANDHS